MKILDNRAEEIKIAYIGGGSRGWAWGLMSDLALEHSLSGTIRLYDIDLEAAKANEVIGNRLFSNREYEGKWKFEAVDSLEKALAGSDFTIISILPGTFDEMQSDIEEPAKYGVYQSVGDTVGSGGILRALRTIPMYEVIGKAIADFSPDTWVINYTNPMTVCVKTLYEVFPNIKVVGCCHEVFGAQKLLAKAAEEFLGIEGLSREDIETSVAGINHFTWINSASVRGHDLMDAYSKFTEKYKDTGYHDCEKGHWLNSHFSSGNRVKFDLFQRHHVIAAAGDRHLVEFLPGVWYLKNEECIKEWMFSLTPISWRKEHQMKEKLEESQRLVSGKQEFKVEPTGEDGIRIIRALCGLDTMIANVNVKNQGQMSQVPLGSVVETNALIRKNSVEPVCAGLLPQEICTVLNHHISNQNAIVQAGLNRDLEDAYKVFMNDYQLSALSPAQTRELFDTMVSNTKAYLKEYME